MTRTNLFVVICLVGCNIGPRVKDAPDAARPPDAPPDAPSGFKFLLPAGTDVPSISTDAGLLVQIRLNDGIADAATFIPRGTGKSAGATVRFWNFGPAPFEMNVAGGSVILLPILAPLYIIGRNEAGVFTPIPEHPRMIDTVPGDTRYSPIRRVFNVPVTSLYNNELITSVAALGEAIELGLVEDPVPDGTFVNMPVVLPGMPIEVMGSVAMANQVTLPPTQVFGRGYTVDVHELGTSVFMARQPLRAGVPSVVIGQSSGLQTGVATGTPPVKSTAIDAQPVFQFAIPTTPPTVFQYTPLVQDVTVRLANGIAPAAITGDSDLFTRSATFAMTGVRADNVETFTVNTLTINNMQLQYVDGAL